MEEQEVKKNFFEKLKSFPRMFWVANSIELIERWGWYGVYNLLAVYLTASRSEGALGFSQKEKGILMGTVTAMVYFLPLFTGAVSDKVGYKKSLIVAFSLYFIGFFWMLQTHTYGLFFAAFAIVGLGAAIFKPIISATISKTTTEKTVILGFGIYYMIVNLGALIGPVIASKLREHNWDYVFYSSMFAVALNLVFVLLLYKEPDREPNTDELRESLKKILNNIITAVSDWKFLIFLVIIAGFWTMYVQLFFTLPVFVEQWVDTSVFLQNIKEFLPWLGEFLDNGKGTINPEMMLNMDALFIVFFQLIISSIVTNIKPMRAMVSGFLISAIGIGLMFMFNNPLYIVISILIFSVGEMTGSPTITAYIGMIADKDKKALYMGMSFLPVAVGNFLGGYLSGSVYEKMSDKITMIKHIFVENNWTVPKITEKFTKEDFINLATQKLNMSHQQLTDYLWNTYHPDHIWYVFTGIGIFSVVLLFLFDRFIMKSK